MRGKSEQRGQGTIHFEVKIYSVVLSPWLGISLPNSVDSYIYHSPNSPHFSFPFTDVFCQEGPDGASLLNLVTLNFPPFAICSLLQTKLLNLVPHFNAISKQNPDVPRCLLALPTTTSTACRNYKRWGLSRSSF